MAVNLQISYETLVELVEQLQRVAQQRQLTKEERKALFEATISSIPMKEEPSIRREDWYDDDGRLRLLLY